LIPGDLNAGLEHDLEELPEVVAKALLEWRKASLERDRKEAILYLSYKGSEEKRTVTEIEALVDANDDRYALKLAEAVAESEYTRVYEKLLSQKRLANLRTAF